MSLADFEAAVLTGDLDTALPLLKALRKLPDIETLDHDHKMDGLTAEEHTRHIRFHEDEYRKLKAQFAHETDPDVQQAVLAAMQQCVTHWHAHRQAKHCPPLKPKDKLIQPGDVERTPEPTVKPTKPTKPTPVRKALEGEAGEPPARADRDFSYCAFNLSEDAADILRHWAADTIAEADLSGDGFDKQPHITVRYGLHTNESIDLQAAVAGFDPVSVTVGKVSVFAGEAYDVVKLDVSSPALVALHNRLGELPHTDTFPDYQPHITLAYVKSGAGAQYAGRETPLSGQPLTFGQLTFSNKQRQLFPVTLGEPLAKGLPVLVEERPMVSTEWRCPHCQGEISERGGLFRDGDRWTHRACGNEVTLPGSPGDAPLPLDGSIVAGSVEDVARFLGELCRQAVRQAEGTNPETGSDTRLEYQGIPLYIENPRGDTRSGTGPDGDWETTMSYPYGYIEGTVGMDSDPVDVFLGTDPDAPLAFIITQHDIGKVLKWPGGCCPQCGNLPADCEHALDEEKVMLGFTHESEALQCYTVSYNDPDRFLGPVQAIPTAMLLGYLKERAPLKKALNTKAYADTCPHCHKSNADLRVAHGECSHCGKKLTAIEKPGEQCPHCGAWHERDSYTGKCNHCMREHPLRKALAADKHAFLKVHPSGMLHVHTPYHKPFTEELKQLPPEHRKWNKAAGHWEVHPHHHQAVMALIHKHWDAEKHPKDAAGKFTHTGEGVAPQPEQHPLHDPVGLAMQHLSSKNVFSAKDAKFGHSIAKQSMAKPLTWKQVEAAHKVLGKYKEHVPALEHDALWGDGAKAALSPPVVALDADRVQQVAQYVAAHPGESVKEIAAGTGFPKDTIYNAVDLTSHFEFVANPAAGKGGYHLKASGQALLDAPPPDPEVTFAPEPLPPPVPPTHPLGEPGAAYLTGLMSQQTLVAYGGAANLGKVLQKKTVADFHVGLNYFHELGLDHDHEQIHALEDVIFVLTAYGAEAAAKDQEPGETVHGVFFPHAATYAPVQKSAVVFLA